MLTRSKISSTMVSSTERLNIRGLIHFQVWTLPYNLHRSKLQMWAQFMLLILTYTDIISLREVRMYLHKTIVIYSWFILLQRTKLSMRPVLKVMPRTLLFGIWYQRQTSVVRQWKSNLPNNVQFCCCLMDGSKGAVWQNGLWHGRACEANYITYILPIYTHWCLLNNYGDQIVDVSAVRLWAQ